MIKRLHIYFKERFPIIPRFFLAAICLFEIYFIVLLNCDIRSFKIGIQELVGVYTIFAFVLWLRIADDLKDYETDKKLFKDRPLPSGRTKIKDVRIACGVIEIIAIALNVIFMPHIHLVFLGILYFYGFLMRNWFFQEYKISRSLPLALITHNPVQIFVNLYTISFTIIKYGLKPITLVNVLAIFTLYFPALIWEIGRKIRAPKDETEYTTYSKLFGYKKSTKFIMVVTIVDIITNFMLVYNLNRVSILILAVLVSWMTWKFVQFIKNPERFELVKKIELYTYLQELTMLATVVIYLVVGKI